MANPKRHENDKLTSVEAAHMLGVERRAVIRMADRGALRVIQAYPGAHRRFRRADIEALMNGQEEAS